MRRFILIKSNLWAWQIWNFPKSDKLTQNLKHPQTPFSLTQFHSCQNITFDHSRRHCQRPNESFIIVLGIFTNFPPLFCAQWKFFVLNCHHQEKNLCHWDGKQWISEFHIKNMLPLSKWLNRMSSFEIAQQFSHEICLTTFSNFMAGSIYK